MKTVIRANPKLDNEQMNQVGGGEDAEGGGPRDGR